MKLSEWINPKQEKPTKVGVYERKGFGFNDVVFTYWNGEYFGYLGKTPNEALKEWNNTGGSKSYHQDYPWRGVVEAIE